MKQADPRAGASSVREPSGGEPYETIRRAVGEGMVKYRKAFGLAQHDDLMRQLVVESVFAALLAAPPVPRKETLEQMRRRFPEVDNHHNAICCPYCTPALDELLKAYSEQRAVEPTAHEGETRGDGQPVSDGRPTAASNELTHAALVRVAARWLKQTARCSVVLTEAPAMQGESPDAIGWKSGSSVLIECKVSRSDFVADLKKPHRVAGSRLGRRAFYLTPPGLLAPSDVPARWGLLEAHPHCVRVIRDTPEDALWRDDRGADDLRHEIVLLWAELRRYHAQRITYKTMTGKPAQAHLLEAVASASAGVLPDSQPHGGRVENKSEPRVAPVDPEAQTDEAPPWREEARTHLACGEPAPDRSGRFCNKPQGHDGQHWTYGGGSMSWGPATTPLAGQEQTDAPKEPR